MAKYVEDTRLLSEGGLLALISLDGQYRTAANHA